MKRGGIDTAVAGGEGQAPPRPGHAQGAFLQGPPEGATTRRMVAVASATDPG
ncbi:MAG: hypothetical protein ACTHK2_10050 [Dokdonella sp.]|uniref:hypothetical protein n=1 Tax=Dokdonella sp. TaxID=2291710 RepID=UPI003F7F262B